MDKTIARLNIEHFRALLATRVDASKRQLLLQLLTEEEAKLAKLDTPVDKAETASPKSLLLDQDDESRALLAAE